MRFRAAETNTYQIAYRRNALSDPSLSQGVDFFYFADDDRRWILHQ